MYLIWSNDILPNIKHLIFSLIYEKNPRKIMIKEKFPSLRKPMWPKSAVNNFYFIVKFKHTSIKTEDKFTIDT